MSDKGFIVVVTRVVDEGFTLAEAKQFALTYRNRGYRTEVVTFQEGRRLAAKNQQDLTLLAEDGSLSLCSICGRPWQDHYKATHLKYKAGPFGSFGLKNGEHLPHIRGVHREKEREDG